jgi:hypothetical protein
MEAIKARIIKGIDEGLRQWELLSEIHGSDYNSDAPEARMAHVIFNECRDWQDARKNLIRLLRETKRQASFLEEKMCANDLIGASFFKSNTPNGQNRIQEEVARLEQIESNLNEYFWIIDLDSEYRLAFFEAIRVPADEA